MEAYHLPLPQALNVLFSFQVFPYATFIMAAIAVISLLVTFSMYDKIMLLGTNSREITPKTAKSHEEKQLYNVIDEMKVASGLSYMPKVYIIDADYMNAFASGYSEKSAMVAITRGLMQKLNREELQAVMAHELSHIRHHDIKLTLTVAVLTNIMLIVIDLLFYNMLFRGNRRDNGEGNKGQIFFIVIMILRFVLPIITVMLAMFLSRTREYMADAGAVELMRDNEPLANALKKITYDHRDNAKAYSDQYGDTAHEDVRRASYIYDPSKIDPVKSVTSKFSTHPSLEQRLKALGFKAKK
jgi:heat shock protein HtpX